MTKKLISVLLSIVMIFMVCSCNKNVDSIATLDGEVIEEAYFNYYFVATKKSMQENFGETAWQNATFDGKLALDYVRDRALQDAVDDKIITDKAAEDGIKLTDDDKKQMESVKDQWISLYGGKNEFENGIKKDYGLILKQFDYLLEAAYLEKHLIDKYVSDSDIRDYYNKNVVKVKQILIPTVVLGSNIPLTEDELKVNEEMVDEILVKIKNGEDFDSLVSQYTSAKDMFYYVGKGFVLNSSETSENAMPEEFETVAFDLELGEVSKAVESPVGYHIIKRYENDDDMLDNGRDTMALTLFTEVLADWKSQKNLVVNNEIYNSYK